MRASALSIAGNVANESARAGGAHGFYAKLARRERAVVAD